MKKEINKVPEGNSEKVPQDQLNQIDQLKKRIELENSQLQLAQIKLNNAQLQLNNFMLALMVEYRLSKDDSINPDGSIQRKEIIS